MTSPTSADLLARLVAFDTTSRNTNLPLVRFVEGYFADHGIGARRIVDDTGEKANLWITIGPDAPGGFVLSGHTDVVPVDGQDWSSDPFELVEREGRLYGRGSCDMKGFLACVMAAVPRMLTSDLVRPIHIAFSYDEEVGCVGARRMVKRLASDGVAPAFCVVGEPTMMEVVTGHKGKRSLKVTARGLACHSSLAPQGVNAVDYAAMMVVRMREMAQRFASEGRRDEAFDVPFSTAHTGTISGGTALNIVPDECSFLCEFRVLPGEDPDAYVADIRAYANELTREMQAVSPQAGIEVEVYAGFPGLDTPPEAEIATLAKSFAGANGHSKVAYGTEAGLFSEFLGCQTIVCGPGSIAVAHRPDEYVERSQLERCDRFLDRLIAWNTAGAR